MSSEVSRTRRSTAGRTLAVKVPEITVYFWLVKALTTAFGESASDFMVHSMNPILAVLIGFVAFWFALATQLRAPRYVAVRYWFAVAMVGVFGTMAADVLHVGFHVPYVVSTILFVIVLVLVFVSWNAREHTLDIHSVRTRQRELFYWAAVVATFALGTAAGDMTATTLHLGYFSSGLMFAGAIAVPAVGYWRFGLNPVVGFWAAYVLTRPLGASFADWFGVSHARGGLALGPGPVCLVLGALIVGFVGYLAHSKPDVPRENDPVE